MLPLHNYYFLVHAFDAIGRWLFPDWRGDEIAQRYIDPPDVIASAREPHETRLKEIYAEHDRLEAENAVITDAAKIAANTEKMKRLLQERTALGARLHTMFQLDETYYRERAKYEKRTKAKDVLFEALKSGAIQAQFLAGPYINWPSWSRERGFKCYLALSLVRLKRPDVGIRRGAALIRRDELDDWLDKTFPRLQEPVPEEALTPEQRCEAWLVKFKAESGGRPPGTKNAIYLQAREIIPELSRREFDRAWSRVAGEDWKKSGRRPVANPRGT